MKPLWEAMLSMSLDLPELHEYTDGDLQVRLNKVHWRIEIDIDTRVQTVVGGSTIRNMDVHYAIRQWFGLA